MAPHHVFLSKILGLTPRCALILLLTLFLVSQRPAVAESVVEPAVLGGSFHITTYKILESRPPFRPVTMCDDKEGMVYAGGLSGVRRFDGVSWRKLFDTSVRVMLSNDAGDVYAAGADGVFRFDAQKLYTTERVQLIEQDEQSQLRGQFERAARVGNDVFIMNVATCARFRRLPDGSDSVAIWKSQEVLPHHLKYRYVGEANGKPLALLEQRDDFSKSRFAWVEEDGSVRLLPEVEYKVDGKPYGKICNFFVQLEGRTVPFEGDAIDVVVRGADRIFRVRGGQAFDITPHVIAHQEAQIVNLHVLPGNRIAVLARGVGFVIFDLQGTVLHRVYADHLPAFWTTSLFDRSGRVWVPGEKEMHQVDYHPQRSFWQVPNGEAVYSLAFVGQDYLLVGTHSNAYYARLQQWGADRERFVPLAFHHMGPRLGRTKDIEIVDGRPILATLSGLYDWDPEAPVTPARKIVDGAFHNLLYDAVTQRLFAFGIWSQRSLVLKKSEAGEWTLERELEHLKPSEDPVVDATRTIWTVGHRLKPESRMLQSVTMDKIVEGGVRGFWIPVVFEGHAYAAVDTGQFPTFYRVINGQVASEPDAEFAELFDQPAASQWMGSVVDQSVTRRGDLLVSTDRESVVRIARSDTGKLQISSVFGGFAYGRGRAPIEGPGGGVWAGVDDRIYFSKVSPYSSDANKSRVWISSVSLANSRILSSTDDATSVPLQLQELEKNRAQFSYDYEPGTLRIEFGVPTTLYPERVTFRTRMIGLNDHWTAPSFESIREFPALPGGDYVFEVDAMLPDGTFTGPSRLEIKVNPPWYETSWFSAVMLLATFAIALGLFRWKTELERRQVKRLQAEVKERQLAQEQLIEYQSELVRRERLRALGEMAAGVAHDLNNALTPVLAFSGLLNTKQFVDDSQRFVWAEMVEKGATDAARIVTRLSPLYRQTVDEQTLQALPDLITDVVRSVAGASDSLKKRIRFKTDLQPASLVCSPSDIREVLTNLVRNSIDAIRSEGTIELACRAIDGYVVIDVTDDGCGMTPEQTKRCFETFYTSKRDRGAGLGLAVCVSVVKSYGGELSVASELGRGARVTVKFPIDIEPFLASATAFEGELPPMRILLVEDIEQTRVSVRVLLETLNQTVVEADNGLTALSMTKREEFDVVVTDHSLPGLTGYELCRKLAGRRGELSLVIMSGHEQSGINEVCDCFLPKPISLPQLRGALMSVYQKRGETSESSDR